MDINKVKLKAKDSPFEAMILRAAEPKWKILFAAGSGGNPERHLPLLNAFMEHGCTVVAPYFDRITSPTPSKDELHMRITALGEALDSLSSLSVPTFGVGHSIGATLLVALAGGQMWMRSEEQLLVQKTDNFKKLVLFAPPTGFFRAPKALEEVQMPIQIWAGSRDTIAPIEEIRFLQEELPMQTVADLRIVDEAGHFSFMNVLPPNVVDSMSDRENFLSHLSEEVCRFIMT